ncbi:MULTISPECIES: transposase [unclassified Microcoleus]
MSDNVLLIFLPLYSSELNSIERVWQHIKRELSWEIYENLD